MIDPELPVEKIVSGGQTGADRAALEWAIEFAIPHGGWCPKGRRAEDGPIDPWFELEETETDAYPVRTKFNVRDSDGTVIFTLAENLQGGSKLTEEFAHQLGKPCIHISKASMADPEMALRRFVSENSVHVLNVAGPRSSTELGVDEFVAQTLSDAFLVP